MSPLHKFRYTLYNFPRQQNEHYFDRSVFQTDAKEFQILLIFEFRTIFNFIFII